MSLGDRAFAGLSYGGLVGFGGGQIGFGNGDLGRRAPPDRAPGLERIDDRLAAGDLDECLRVRGRRLGAGTFDRPTGQLGPVARRRRRAACRDEECFGGRDESAEAKTSTVAVATSPSRARIVASWSGVAVNGVKPFFVYHAATPISVPWS